VSKFAPVSGGKTQYLYTIFLGDQSLNATMAKAVNTDNSGNVVVAGLTSATGFPTKNAFQPVLGGGGALDCPTEDGTAFLCGDAFLAKFSGDGRTLLFSTYYGGKYTNYFNAVAIDGAGGIYAVGVQDDAIGTDLRGTPNALQQAPSGSVGMMATRWDANGQLLYASYLGGAGQGIANSVAVEKPGVVWVGGDTDSANMPMPAVNKGLQTQYTAWAKSAYLARLDMNQSGAAGLTYASYFGGPTGGNTSLNKLFLDPSGQVVFCGATFSSIPVTATGMQQVEVGVPPSRVTDNTFLDGDGYIARINPAVAGNAGLTYSSYVGGSDSEAAVSCGLDPKGNLVVAGWTLSTDLFFVAGSPIPYKFATGVSASNVFLIRIDPTRAGGRVDSILFGGTASDVAYAMAIDSHGFAYVVGQTFSQTFPVTPLAVQKAYGGDNTTYLGGGLLRRRIPSASGGERDPGSRGRVDSSQWRFSVWGPWCDSAGPDCRSDSGRQRETAQSIGVPGLVHFQQRQCGACASIHRWKRSRGDERAAIEWRRDRRGFSFRGRLHSLHLSLEGRRRYSAQERGDYFRG
jgi:hypothetical protein